jgi:hypothetical protein
MDTAQRQKPKLTEWLDFFLKAGGFAVALSLAYLGWQQYLDKLDSEAKADQKLKERGIEQREEEHSLKFYEKQLGTYMEVCDLVGRSVSNFTVRVYSLGQKPREFGNERGGGNVFVCSYQW